jgi:putative SOS response-associated peptidase YedK
VYEWSDLKVKSFTRSNAGGNGEDFEDELRRRRPDDDEGSSRSRSDLARNERSRRFNVPPTEKIMAVTFRNGERIAEEMRWGLIPSWAKELPDYPTHNARADGIDTKATFRGAWRKGQRCLVIHGGFYEWRRAGKDKQAFAVGMADDSNMVCAGLWDEWLSPDGELIRSCTIITTEPNSLIAEIHDRMPVILGKQDWAKWLGEEQATGAELFAMLRPCPPERMKMWPVDKRVNSVQNDDAELIKPVTVKPPTPEPPQQPSLF